MVKLKLYADENFERPVVEKLREKGYDILTAQEAGNANQGIPDDDVLVFAIGESRAVITLNYNDFKNLHKQGRNHYGIIICTIAILFEFLRKMILMDLGKIKF